MARVKKMFVVSEKNLEYIEEVKGNNNFKYNSEALDLIIREHRTNSDITTDYMIKLIAEKVSEQMKSEIKGIKFASNSADKNTQILLELINGLFIISNYGRLATTEDIKAEAFERATDLVESRIKNKRISKLDKEY